MGRTYRKRRRHPQNLVHSQQMKQLYAWIQKLGFRASCSLRLARTPASGRGLICLQKIQPGDVILALPQSLLITPKLVESEYGLEKNVFSAEEVLTIFVIIEKLLQQKSRWKHYIDSIPNQFDSVNSMREPQGLPRRLHLAIGKWNDCARKAFSKIHRYFLDKGVRLTHENFDWAWCAVNTRCIYVEGYGSTLAPFLDMLNHHWKARIETSFENNQFVIRSQDYYETGEEVFISYGSHDNRTLFLNYGFVLDDNPNDCVTVEISHLEKLNELEKIFAFEDKIRFLEKYTMLTEQTGFTRDGATWNLEVVLRVLEDDTVRNWKSFFATEAGCSSPKWKKRLAAVMLSDYNCDATLDFMREKLLGIERQILLSVINGGQTDGIT